MDLENVQNPFEEYGWIKLGPFWGLFMYIFMVLLFPLIDGEGLSTWKVVLGIPIWTIGGIGFGYTMKLINGKNIKKQNQIE